MQHIARKIHKHLLAAEKVVIIPHQNPDGDAIGAATAVKEYLTELGKEATIFCITPVTPKLHFVPHSTTVTSDEAIFEDDSVHAIIILDSGDLRYAGVDHLVKNHPAKIINIDHHATNEQYGHFNLVDSKASSTCELIFHFFNHNNISLNQNMATSLLTGLTTDTGNFTNAATTASALLVGGELIRAGANFNQVIAGTTRNKSMGTLRLWGTVLGRLQKDERLDLTYTYITQKDLAKHEVSEEESEGIANFLNNLENTKIALILKETSDGKIKGSFRTTQDDVDVSALAKKLGGGGHKKAAGFAVEGNIEEVLKKILTA